MPMQASAHRKNKQFFRKQGSWLSTVTQLTAAPTKKQTRSVTAPPPSRFPLKFETWLAYFRLEHKSPKPYQAQCIKKATNISQQATRTMGLGLAKG
jgi:hypothetical protein